MEDICCIHRAGKKMVIKFRIGHRRVMYALFISIYVYCPA